MSVLQEEKKTFLYSFSVLGCKEVKRRIVWTEACDGAERLVNSRGNRAGCRESE